MPVDRKVLEELCKENGWLSEATPVQKEKIFMLAEKGMPISYIAPLVWLFVNTSEMSIDEVEKEIIRRSRVYQVIDWSKGIPMYVYKTKKGKLKLLRHNATSFSFEEANQIVELSPYMRLRIVSNDSFLFLRK